MRKKETNVIIIEKKANDDKEDSMINEGRKILNKSELPGYIRKCSRTESDQTESTQVQA